MFELEIREEKKFSLFKYHPSLVAAIIFVALFGITTGYHGFQAARKRTYYFIPLIIGGTCKSDGILAPHVSLLTLEKLRWLVMLVEYLLRRMKIV